MMTGRVKRKEYLMYLLSVRDEESTARQIGLTIKSKTIKEIRAQFEAEHGSIFDQEFDE